MAAFVIIFIAIALFVCFIAGIGSIIMSIFFNAGKFLFGGFFRTIEWILDRGANAVAIFCVIALIYLLWSTVTHAGG